MPHRRRRSSRLIRVRPPARQPLVPNSRPYTTPQGIPVEADQFTIDTINIIDGYRQSTDDKTRSGLRNKLVAVLAKKFDSQHRRREQEINDQKARLKQLAELHAKRGADRKGIIDRHAELLLREVDGLGWETDPPTVTEEAIPTWTDGGA
jgi:hypothetical protein